MKQCKCGETNPKKFGKKRDGLQSECRACRRQMVGEHYHANTQYYVDKARKRKQEIRALIVAAKTDKSCADCHLPYPSWILSFDHLPGQKKCFELSSMKALSMSKQTVLDEINKCEVVCHNCHAERTHSRQCPRSLVERHQSPELSHVGSNPAEGTVV